MVMRSKVLLMTMVLIMTIVASNPAFAGTSVYSGNRAYTVNNDRQAKICDNSRDTATGFVRYVRSNGNPGEKRDPDGAGGSCGTSAYGQYKIVRLKACEEKISGRIACGGWVAG